MALARCLVDGLSPFLPQEVGEHAGRGLGYRLGIEQHPLLLRSPRGGRPSYCDQQRSVNQTIVANKRHPHRLGLTFPQPSAALNVREQECDLASG
jgi:hypothetical protein